VVRGQRLAEGAGNFTGGAAGFGAGAIIGSALEVLRTLGDLAVSLVPEPDGLRLKVRETLQ
jgi:hypothetical protein